MKRWHHNRSKLKDGFTVVELLIVIITIGILAGISTATYGSWQKRAAESELKSDLNAVAVAMKSARNFANTYPTSIPTTYSPSGNIVLQLATSVTDEYCVNAYHTKLPELMYSYDSVKDQVLNVRCSGAPIGSAYPAGSTLPATPKNVNLVAGFEYWDLTGGISYNSSTQELSYTAAGTATSPLVRVQGATSSKITVESYSTVGSPQASCTPNTCVYFTIQYFAADGITPATNTSGFTTNSSAPVTTLSSWVSKTYTAATGSNVVYVKYILKSIPTTYTSDNKIRNPSIQAL